MNRVTDIIVDKQSCDYEKCPGVYKSDDGVTYHGIFLVNDHKEYFDMEMGQQMHFECYVRHVIEKAMKEIKQ